MAFVAVTGVETALWGASSVSRCASVGFRSGDFYPKSFGRTGRSVSNGRSRLHSGIFATASAGGAVTPSTANTGSVAVEPSEEIAVGDTLRITYTPPTGLFEPDTLVSLACGFNGWNGEDKPLVFPATKTGENEYRVHVTVPNFAKSLEFCFTDCMSRWDTNDGEYYKVHVKYQLRVDKSGNLEEVVAGDEPIRNLEAESAFAPVLRPDEEASLHRIRGEAALIGEREGLGNIQISQARDAFERFDQDRTGNIKLKDLKTVLGNIHFDLAEERYNELVRKYVAEEPDDDTLVPMAAFMLLYSELEKDDEGIEMV